MEEKLKNKKKIIVIIVLIAVILCVGGYLVYKNLNKQGKRLDINSELVQDLHDIFYITYSNGETYPKPSASSFHGGKLIMVGDLENSVVSTHAYLAINDGDYTYEEYERTSPIDTSNEELKFSCKISDTLTVENFAYDHNGFSNEAHNYFLQNKCSVQVVPKSSMIKGYEKVFGKNTEDIDFEKDLWVYNGMYCQYDNEKYYCYESAFGYGSGVTIKMVIKEAFQKDEEIHIYDKTLWHSGGEYSYTINENGKEVRIDELEGRIPTEDEILKYGQLYKHTFKQNNDGSYYWYSSEPVR